VNQLNLPQIHSVVYVLSGLSECCLHQCVDFHMRPLQIRPQFTIALNPGFLTLAFVACSTNIGEGLAKLITYSGIPGRWVDVWRIGTFPE